MRLEPGDPAPDFRLLNQDGAEVSLADFAGRRNQDGAEVSLADFAGGAVLLPEGSDPWLNEAGLWHA